MIRMMGDEKQVSVIIPSYNSKETIGECLDSILKQQPECTFELIVVDSSEDDTASFIKRQYPEVKLIESSKIVYPGQARNIGVKQANGQIIVFTDSDCKAQEGWLESIVGLFNNNGDHRIIGGAISNGTRASIVGSAEYFLEFSEFTPQVKDTSVKSLPTCNMAVRKEIIEQYGYFENVIKGSDTLFTRTLVDMGEDLMFSSKFCVVHKNRTNFKKYLKNQYYLGFGAAQIRKIRNIPGSFFIRFPLAILLLPIVRFFRISKRLINQGLLRFLHFLSLSPIVLLGLVSYTIGFAKAAITNSSFADKN